VVPIILPVLEIVLKHQSAPQKVGHTNINVVSGTKRERERERERERPYRGNTVGGPTVNRVFVEIGLNLRKSSTV
jgi:hypothetical protein